MAGRSLSWNDLTRLKVAGQGSLTEATAGRLRERPLGRESRLYEFLDHLGGLTIALSHALKKPSAFKDVS
jgi:hypothetical protein